MGCDIHLRVEKLSGLKWQAAEKMVPNKYAGEEGEPETILERFYSERNYNLFAILADVRNGRGFAGCDTGDGFNPIVEPRGIPEDASDSVREDSEGWGADGHSHSWLTLTEILAFDWTQTTTQRGWVSALEAEEWLRMRRWEPEPPGHCGGVSGGMVKHISIEEMEQRIVAIKAQHPNDYKAALAQIEQDLMHHYAQAEWTIDYASSCGDFWMKAIPKLLKLCEGHSASVRIVFWFDN